MAAPAPRAVALLQVSGGGAGVLVLCGISHASVSQVGLQVEGESTPSLKGFSGAVVVTVHGCNLRADGLSNVDHPPSSSDLGTSFRGASWEPVFAGT